MKTTFEVAAVSLIATALLTSVQFFNSQKIIRKQWSEVSIEHNKGAYFASDFAQFKKENLHVNFYLENPVSEKVLFKTFVKFKEGNKGN